MKIKFKPLGMGSKAYTIQNEKINNIDLSIIEYGGKFIQTEEMARVGIFEAERDENSELWVTLRQKVGPGHWRESADWIDAENYDPDAIYVRQIDRPFAGTPWVMTRQGKQFSGWEVIPNE